MERFECHVIPDQYRCMDMSLTRPLSFCVSNKKVRSHSSWPLSLSCVSNFVGKLSRRSLGCALLAQDESACMMAFLGNLVQWYNNVIQASAKAQVRLEHGRPRPGSQEDIARFEDLDKRFLG